MRIVYVTSTLPYGAAEAFIVPEIEALLRRGHDVRVVPVRPRGAVVHGDAQRLVERALHCPALSRRVLQGAAASAWDDRTAAVAAVAPILLHGGPRIRAKNAAVLPKAL